MENYIIDIIIALVLGYFTFAGAKRGFILEISRIISLISGFIIANKFNDEMNVRLLQLIENDAIRSVLSYLLVFIIVVFIIGLVAKILQRIFEFILLGWLNRLLGILLGMIKGIFIVVVLIFIFDVFPGSEKRIEQMALDSKLFSICNGIKDNVMNRSEIKTEVDKAIEKVSIEGTKVLNEIEETLTPKE
jgi:membrane protein required for colicin V production